MRREPDKMTVSPDERKEILVEHKEWRRSPHIPKRPKDASQAGGYRVTRGRYQDGESFVLSDYCKASKNPARVLDRPWRGVTEFHSNPNPEESGAPNSAARWLTPRGPGNQGIMRIESKEETD